MKAEQSFDRERHYRLEEWDYLRTSIESEVPDIPEDITSIALRFVDGVVSFRDFKNTIQNFLEEEPR